MMGYSVLVFLRQLIDGAAMSVGEKLEQAIQKNGRRREVSHVLAVCFFQAYNSHAFTEVVKFRPP
jgi:hypothetical protein